jgi:glycosyltransferase involved in cell wall biosynthesis
MKICLVTTFPPSQGGLSEYGLHLAEELRRNPFISLTILADKMSPALPELEGFDVRRCWSFDDPLNSVRILTELGKLKPDVVWFNLLFSTFGRNPLNAFMGLLTPVFARLSGRYTHVTLHHLMDTVDLKDAGIRHPRIYRAAGAVATRMLLLSNSVSVLMPGYRTILSEKYGRDNVHVRSHGVLTRRPEYPDFARRGNPQHRILAFGKWGTYKRLELMLEAFQIVNRALPNAKLVIGGGDHPQASGYVESVRQKCAGNPAIEFTGYVHEDRLPDMFQESTVAVMPYSSSTGCSGVAHLACAYGVPILCADLPDFRQMAEGEELAMEFYKPGDAEDLASFLIQFLEDPEKQQAMAIQNFSTALRMTMPTIVQKYLRHFELEQRTEALRRVTRIRRMPSWIPNKARMLRMMTRNSPGWVYRSGVPRLPGIASSRKPLLNQSLLDQPLLDNDVDGSGNLRGTGIPHNGDGIALRTRYGSTLGFSAASSTGNGTHSESDQSEQSAELDAAPAGVTAESQSHKSERQQEAGVNGNGFSPFGMVHPSNGSGGNGQSGSSGARAGRNGSGGEGAL